MAEQPDTQLRRRRRLSGNPNLPLNLEVGFQIDEGGPSQETPSPSCYNHVSSSRDESTMSARLEFRKKQQSFDIQIEECEEEEITIDSDDEADEGATSEIRRAVTPTPFQDFGANVVYTEGPQATDFLKVIAVDQDCITDVSDADSEEEGEEE